MLLLIETLKMRKVGVLLLEKHFLLYLLFSKFNSFISVILLLRSIKGFRVIIILRLLIKVLIRDRLRAHMWELQTLLVYLRCQFMELHLGRTWVLGGLSVAPFGHLSLLQKPIHNITSLLLLGAWNHIRSMLRPIDRLRWRHLSVVLLT